MKVRRPERFDAAVWEVLPHGARLAVMSKYARTPEQRGKLERASMAHGLRKLERALKDLEGASTRPGGEDD